jgi:serine/threonine protein kinase
MCRTHRRRIAAFAQVRLAEHIPTGQRVAIKLFDKTKKLSEYEMKNFYREATVLRRIQTQHACAAFQFLDAECAPGPSRTQPRPPQRSLRAR